MQSLFIWAICIIAISLVVIVTVRIRLKNKSKELSKRIATITSYRDIQESREKELKQSNKSFFIDIEILLSDKNLSKA
jgi:DNA helicase-4